MPKGYWIARIDVSDMEAYRLYISANGAALAKHGARFLVRSGPFDNPEGESRSRNIVIEFPSFQAAKDCYNSPEYQAAIPLRAAASDGDVIIIEGYDGAQPGG
jgi:uncharacterized protein (DUF1330 family)